MPQNFPQTTSSQGLNPLPLSHQRRWQRQRPRSPQLLRAPQGPRHCRPPREGSTRRQRSLRRPRRNQKSSRCRAALRNGRRKQLFLNGRRQRSLPPSLRPLLLCQGPGAARQRSARHLHQAHLSTRIAWSRRLGRAAWWRCLLASGNLTPPVAITGATIGSSFGMLRVECFTTPRPNGGSSRL